MGLSKKTPPPVLNCNADKYTINRGDAVDITIKSTVGGLIFAFGSSEGTLIVKGNTAKLNTAGVSEKTKNITVVCSAVDQYGQIVQATTQVTFPPQLVAKRIDVVKPPFKGYQFSGVVAPSLSWTAGTQTQTISGGSVLLSDVKSNSYCDTELRQFGIAANASDTSTTKLTGPTSNIDNNELKFSATRAAFSQVDAKEEKARLNDPIEELFPGKRYANSYIGAGAAFMDNNLLGIGLQQTYTAEYQHYLRKCADDSSLKKDGTDRRQFFASVGVGAGYMNQRLYATQNRLSAAVLPLSAQLSFIKSSATGVPPKYFAYFLLGYMPVLTDMHAYQVGGTVGLQIPTKVPWLTFSLTETDLYMNNAPTGFKRNYQNGTVSALITFPAPPAKQPNPALPESAKGSCYGGDKLARLYCFDGVTADACAPPNMFRAAQHCTSAGAGGSLTTLQEILRDKMLLERQQKLNDLLQQQQLPQPPPPATQPPQPN